MTNKRRGLIKALHKISVRWPTPRALAPSSTMTTQGSQMLPEEHAISLATRYHGEDEKQRVVDELQGLVATPHLGIAPIQVSIILRDRFGVELAEELLIKFMGISTQRTRILFELIYSLAICGYPERSVIYSDLALQERRLTPAQMAFAATQFSRVGRRDAAEGLLRTAVAEDPALHPDAVANIQFYRFLARYPLDGARDILREIRSMFRNPGLEEIEQDIANALRNGIPYLLLRMGDGEGSCIRIGIDDEADYNSYYSANRKEFSDIWFKDTSVVDDDAFCGVIDSFNSIIAQADCIGGIHLSAIEHEYRLGSRRGIAWVVNTMRKVCELGRRDRVWASRVPIYSLVIHYDLLLSGCLHRIMQGRSQLGLISCHSELAEKLRVTFGIGNIEFFKIPGEKSHAGQLTEADLAGRHWPDRFNEICSLLENQDRHGQLFLVAAGFLGKIYAAKLKRAGAVVLDIGAVADMWMGRKTRSFPHLPDHLALS